MSKQTSNGRYRNATTSKATSTSFQQPTRDFRYSSYRTEKERIANNIKINQEFCDSVPNPDKFAFHKSLRARDESKEIGPSFRYTAKTGIERVYDQLKTRITTAFQIKELASEKLNSTLKHKREQNHTISPKQILPSIHNKTHFKAATSVFLRSELENSLKDKSNFLSRALRDVSPGFASMSIDAPAQTNLTTSPNNKVHPIMKHGDNKNEKHNIQSVSFIEDAKVCLTSKIF